MKGRVFKSAVVYVGGWLTTKLWIIGFHPVAVALFMATWCSRLIRVPIFPIITLGIISSSGFLVGIKYGLVMLTIAIVLNIMEEKHRRVPILQAVMLGGGVLLVMEAMDLYMSGKGYMQYGMAFLSTILAISLGIIFYKIIEMFQMPKGKVKEKTKKEAYKEQLDTYEERMNSVANAFAIMAKNMEKVANADILAVEDMLPTWCEKEKQYCVQCQRFKRQVEIYRNKLNECRRIIVNQFNEMARILGECTENTYDFCVVTDLQRILLMDKLKQQGVSLEKVVRLNNRKGISEIILTIRAKKGKTVTISNISNIVEDVFGKNVEPVQETTKLIGKDMTTYRFKEKPNYFVLHGIASSGKEEVSGDNFSYLELDNGQTLLGISDGMGTGSDAGRDSGMVLGLLENLMESGFDEESALSLINNVFALEGENVSPATVDMGIIDRYSGVCDFKKLGATSTFVKRGAWVEVINSTTLPIGGSAVADVEGLSKKLYDGDYIIMMSDGVVEPSEVSEQEELGNILVNLKSKKPKEMANEILEKVKEKWPNRRKDDMTVLVTGIWNYSKCS